MTALSSTALGGTSTGGVLAGIAWDPQIAGIAAVAVGVVVLMGSVYLLLATNLANRLGFMAALTGFFGFMSVLGVIWWTYGIGLQGDGPSFQVREVNFGDLGAAATDDVRLIDEDLLPDPGAAYALRDLDEAEFEAAVASLDEQLAGDWEVLPEADGYFGESRAVADELINDGVASQIGVDAPSDVVSLLAFMKGGKSGLPDDPNRFDRVANWVHNTFVQVTHPTRYVVLQLQPTTMDSRPEAAEAGQAPPSPVPDESMPTISVVLVRDLGQERGPAALITLGSGAAFGLLCYMLHTREKRVLVARGMLPAAAASS